MLLLAGRHAKADALWAELRGADPDGVWTLNAGGLAYGEVGRYREALEWLTPGLRLELDRGDAERIVDQLSDARRQALKALGRDRDALEDEVDAFRRRAAQREERQVDGLGAAARATGIPMRGRPVSVAWIGPDDDAAARERWPAWSDGLIVDAPFAELAERMERRLRERRAEGDGPIRIVTIDLDAYAEWCEHHGHDPADPASRSTFVHEAEADEGRRWPPGRNEQCWCGSMRKYSAAAGASSDAFHDDAGMELPGHATGEDAAEARRVAAALDRPLALERFGPRDPAEGWMGYPCEDIPEVLVPVLAAGERDAFEFEMVLVGEEDDLVIDYTNDNQGVRHIIDLIARRLHWLPHDSSD